MATHQRMDMIQRVRLYEAAKLVFDENPKLKPPAIVAAAQKLIPSHLRTKANTSTNTHMRTWLTTPMPTKSPGKSVTYLAPEYSMLLRRYEALKLQHPKWTKTELAEKAMECLPPGRRQNIKKTPSTAYQLDTILAKLGPRVSRPTKDNPFKNAPPVETKPEEPPTAAAAPAPASIINSELGGQIFAALGVAFNTAIQSAAITVGKEIGASVAKSVSDALYEMRMGILSSSRIQSAAATPSAETIADIQARKAANREMPENLRKPKVCLIGLEDGRNQILLREFPHLEFRFLAKHMPGATLKQVAEGCDATYVFIKFVAHSVTDALRKTNGGPGYAAITGGFDAIRLRLTDDFPHKTVHRPQTVPVEHVSAQH